MDKKINNKENSSKKDKDKIVKIAIWTWTVRQRPTPKDNKQLEQCNCCTHSCYGAFMRSFAPVLRSERNWAQICYWWCNWSRSVAFVCAHCGQIKYWNCAKCNAIERNWNNSCSIERKQAWNWRFRAMQLGATELERSTERIHYIFLPDAVWPTITRRPNFLRQIFNAKYSCAQCDWALISSNGR